MRKAQMQEKIDRLEYELKFNKNWDSEGKLKARLRIYESSQLRYKRALELMELRENLTFEQALAALTQLEPAIIGAKGATN